MKTTNTIDFRTEIEALRTEFFLSEQTAKAYAEEYRSWLGLVSANPTQRLVPSDRIDAVWHAHLENPKKYASDCEVLFGPGAKLEHHAEAEPTDLASGWKCTQTLWRDRYAASLKGNPAFCEAELKRY